MKNVVLAVGGNRNLRVAEALMILWLLGAADLLFTAFAIRSPNVFYELNPVARFLLVSHGILGLAALKTVLLGIGAVIFWRLRRFARAEIALWGLVLVHIALIVQWTQYTSIAASALP